MKINKAMGGFLALLLILALVLPLGCSGKIAKPAPPPGCEDSFLWRSGFMPLGPSLVKVAFAGTVDVRPDLCNALLAAGHRAQDLLEAEGVRPAALKLTAALLGGVDNAVVRVVVEDGVVQLMNLAGVPERLLTPCDKAIVKGMVDDVVAMLEVKAANLKTGVPTP